MVNAMMNAQKQAIGCVLAASHRPDSCSMFSALKASTKRSLFPNTGPPEPSWACFSPGYASISSARYFSLLIPDDIFAVDQRNPFKSQKVLFPLYAEDLAGARRKKAGGRQELARVLIQYGGVERSFFTVGYDRIPIVPHDSPPSSDLYAGETSLFLVAWVA